MEVAQRIAVVKKLIAKIFHHPDFDDQAKSKEILAPMPEYQSYLKALVITRSQKPTDEVEIFDPCYTQPLLSREQEAHVFKKYHYCKYRAEKCLSLGNLLKAEEWYKRAIECNHILVGANVRCGVGVCRKFRSNRDYEDWVAESFFQTCRCLDYFDWTRGHRFNTYMTWVMQRSFTRQAGIEYYNDQKYVDVDDEWFEGKEGKSSEYDQVDHNSDVKSLSEELLSKCDPRSREVIKMAFYQDCTLETIGRHFGITKERVRQIKNRALEIMKQEMEKSKSVQARLLAVCS